jgi:histidine ammonia-lyase
LIFTEFDTFIHNGHFHGQPISFVMDCLGISMVNIGVVSVTGRIDRFHGSSQQRRVAALFVQGRYRACRMGLMGGQFMTTSLGCRKSEPLRSRHPFSPSPQQRISRILSVLG